MPIGQIAPLSMTPVEALPDAAPSNGRGRGAPSRWPGIFKNVVNDFAPAVWVKIRDYTPPTQAQATLKKVLKRIAEGEFPGVAYDAERGLILFQDKAAIYADARTVEVDDVRSSVLHLAWQPLTDVAEATPTEGE